MSKAVLRCVDFKPACRGSLRGFASIEFANLMMTIHGITIHVHVNGAAWASPPAQPLIKSGALMKTDTGKVVYSPPLLEFRSIEVRRAWSDAVVREVVKFDPRALECRGAA